MVIHDCLSHGSRRALRTAHGTARGTLRCALCAWARRGTAAWAGPPARASCRRPSVTTCTGALQMPQHMALHVPLEAPYFAAFGTCFKTMHFTTAYLRGASMHAPVHGIANQYFDVCRIYVAARMPMGSAADDTASHTFVSACLERGGAMRAQLWLPGHWRVQGAQLPARGLRLTLGRGAALAHLHRCQSFEPLSSHVECAAACTSCVASCLPRCKRRHNSVRLQSMALRYAGPGQGDVIGCLLHMPEGGQPHERDISVRNHTCACMLVVNIWQMLCCGPFLAASSLQIRARVAFKWSVQTHLVTSSPPAPPAGHVLARCWHDCNEGVHALCARQDVVTWKGQLFFEDKAEPEPRALPGSLVAFTRNGELQGVAYRRALTYSHATQQRASRSFTCTLGSLVAFTRNSELQGVAYRRALTYSHTRHPRASRSTFGQPGCLHVQR